MSEPFQEVGDQGSFPAIIDFFEQLEATLLSYLCEKWPKSLHLCGILLGEQKDCVGLHLFQELFLLLVEVKLERAGVDLAGFFS